MEPAEGPGRGAGVTRKASTAVDGPNQDTRRRGRAWPVRRLKPRFAPGTAYPVGWTRQGKASRTLRMRAIRSREAAKRSVTLRLKRDSLAPSSSRW